MDIRREEIRDRVENLLRRADIQQAPVNLDHVAKFLGLEIKVQDIDDDSDISGCLIRKGDRAVIGVNGQQHKNRQRFTIAHEIAHFLLHEGETFHLDRAGSFRVNFRNAESSTGANPEEVEANFFAAELLMPETFLVEDLQKRGIDLSDDDSALNELANHYGVSVQALTYRLANLGALPA